MKAYLPSLFCFGLAALFMIFPILAAILVSAALVFFGLIYFFMISQFKRMSKQQNYGSVHDPIIINPDESVEPNFKNVTVKMLKRTSWFDN